MTIVYRQAGDKPGPDISESVLTTLASRIERGTQEINANDTDRVLETLSILSTTFVAPTKIASIQSRGRIRNGDVSSFSLQIANSRISSSIVVEVPK